MLQKVFTFQGIDVIITPVIPKSWQFWKKVKFQVEYDRDEVRRRGVNEGALISEIKNFISEN